MITPAMIRFFRRVIRDYHHRGASVERTQKMWRDVIEGEQKYIVPFRDLADKCIDTTHIYEPFLYLEEVSNISKDDTNASIYLTIFESDIIFDRANLSEDSLIWEFVG